MSDFDVSMRLNFDYKSQNAERAERDLKDIGKAAKGLKKVGTDKLEKDLQQVSRNARKAGDALQVPADKLRQLDRLKTDRVAGEIKQLKAISDQLSTELTVPVKHLRQLNRTSLDKASDELKSLATSSDILNQKVAAAYKGLRKLNRLKTDKIEDELRSLGRAADTVNEKLDRVHKPRRSTGSGRTHGGLINPQANAGRFGEALYDRTPVGAYVPLGSGGAAATGAGVAAGVVVSAKAFKHYAGADRRMTILGMNADATEEETKDANRRVRKLAFDLSIPVEQAVSGLEDIIASGVESLEKALEILPTTLKASMASGTPSSLMATALKTTLDQMELSPEQLPLATDTIITGGRMGKFEVEDMAEYLPTLLPIAKTQLGYTGIEGLQKVAADLQVVREASGNSEGAFTRLKDFYLKILQEQTQKNFSDEGYDLAKTVKDAKAKGEDPVEAAIALTQRAVKRDPTVLPRLFSDQESLLAAQAFVANPEGRAHYMGGMRKAAGATEKSYTRVSDDAQASVDRLGNAASNALYGIGKLLDEMGASTLLNAIGGATNSIAERGWRAFPEAWGRMPEHYDRLWTKPATAWVNRQLGFNTTPVSPFPASPSDSDPTQELTDYLEGRSPEVETPAGPKGPPVPRPKPKKLEKFGLLPENLEPAGKLAGAKFASALEAEALKVGPLADDLKDRFSFTATPTISPRFTASVNPGNSAGRATPAAGPATYHQTINGASDPHRTASLITRYQNRQMRTARARALHETGSYA